MFNAHVNPQRSRTEDEEFHSQKGLVLCEDCGAAHFKKRWYHGIEKISVNEDKGPSVKFEMCPACRMIKNKQYEGRITVKNLPERFASRLEEVTREFSNRAFERDPMDRLIEIKKDGDNWVITTTENEMANKLAHKIKGSFSGAKSRTHFAGDPSDVAEVVIDFAA